MVNGQAGAMPDSAGRSHLRIERMLERYPDLSRDELHELLRWFEREASALDVAMVASSERSRPGYDRFRAEHIDRFDWADLVRAALFLAAIGAALLAVIWAAG